GVFHFGEERLAFPEYESDALAAALECGPCLIEIADAELDVGVAVGTAEQFGDAMRHASDAATAQTGGRHFHPLAPAAEARQDTAAIDLGIPIKKAWIDQNGGLDGGEAYGCVEAPAGAGAESDHGEASDARSPPKAVEGRGNLFDEE